MMYSENVSRVELIEDQLKELTTDELKAFREWFAQFDAEIWDRQFESDVRSGKLNDLAERALADHKAGRSTEL